jgi:hypothetical protein
MKKILFLLLLAIALNTSAQNTNNIISMDGIGAIKLNMSQEELEELLKVKIPLTNPTDTISGSWQDSASIRYGKVDFQLVFQRSYSAENTFNMIVISIKSNSPLCKTKEGIGIGTDKIKIISVYEQNDISIIPDYEDELYELRSKTKASICVKNESRKKMILFHLVNKKVTGYEVKTAFSDEE